MSGTRPPPRGAKWRAAPVVQQPSRDGLITVTNRTATKTTECEIRQGKAVDAARLAELFGVDEASIYFEPCLSRGAILMEGDLVAGAKYVICGDEVYNDSEKDMCKVALGYSEVMLQHVPANDRILEAPRRLSRAVDALASNQLIARHFGENMFQIPVRPATKEEIYRVQKKELYEGFLEEGQPPKQHCVPTDVYYSPGSRDAALMAAGITIEGARLVARGEYDSVFCLVRPPGHHCGETPNGFCLINNVAVAVRDLLVGNPRMRIAIVDCDVHHGDGTQIHVGSDNRILFVSMHRYDQARFFPNSGHMENTGDSKQCLNIPFDTAPISADEGGVRTISDYCFEEATRSIILPTLKKFNPDIIFLSCGFDASDGDPLGGMGVVNGYHRLVTHLKTLRPKIEGRRHLGLVCVLEGGYNPKALSEGVVAVVTALLVDGEELPCVDPPQWSRLRSEMDPATVRAQHYDWIKLMIQRVASRQM